MPLFRQLQQQDALASLYCIRNQAGTDLQKPQLATQKMGLPLQTNRNPAHLSWMGSFSFPEPILPGQRSRLL